MAVISGVVTYKSYAIITAASGDGAAIAAKFSGVVIPEISTTAATAANASGVVTVTWPASAVRCADGIVLDTVSNMVAADVSLTAPILIDAGTRVELAA